MKQTSRKELQRARSRVAAQDSKFPLIGDETENGVEGGAFAGAVGADDSQDAALFDVQVDAVERDGRAERLCAGRGLR